VPVPPKTVRSCARQAILAEHAQLGQRRNSFGCSGGPVAATTAALPFEDAGGAETLVECLGAVVDDRLEAAYLSVGG
jgi:hypothetical protein